MLEISIFSNRVGSWPWGRKVATKETGRSVGRLPDQTSTSLNKENREGKKGWNEGRDCIRPASEVAGVDAGEEFLLVAEGETTFQPRERR